MGDTFLSAACIAYYGAFTGPYRASLVAAWIARSQELSIPASPSCNLHTSHASPAQVRSAVWARMPHASWDPYAPPGVRSAASSNCTALPWGSGERVACHGPAARCGVGRQRHRRHAWPLLAAVHRPAGAPHARQPRRAQAQSPELYPVRQHADAGLCCRGKLQPGCAPWRRAQGCGCCGWGRLRTCASWRPRCAPAPLSCWRTSARRWTPHWSPSC